ncbi:rRNA small subunit pseudouridine methyltransferase Nep1 [Nematocida sp. LUAm3]|nr:rRNA small subunit pseudouridine methyltransferase Nep1 [Nematocida sp. LUAm3]KAI5175819.1 rRNA small subunit pseudouridine methyltransferase Nep1 [Nematocida sp. LUAm2]KAI5178315.1 rRNA small subunit pseudouridine methyltransferase Nep1 [Nematocida sp. LUAm1]
MLTIVLQNARLEVEKTKRGKMLLSSEMPEAKRRKDFHLFRPDILHQTLLVLLDSPLNKSGNLRILIETTEKRVITVNPQTRVPRVYSRFSGLVLQLLERNRIYSMPDREVLLQVEKDSLFSFIPHDALHFGLSQDGKRFDQYVKEGHLPKEKLEKSVFYINVISKGEDEFKDIPTFSLSEYALAAGTCCSKICCILEHQLDIF